MWTEIFIAVVVVAIFYGYNKLKGRNNNEFWDERDVICTTEEIDAQWGKESIHDVSKRLYDEFKGYPYFGSWLGNRTPCLVIRDNELIKSIFIKDFESFSMAHHMVPIYHDMWPATDHERLILRNLQSAHGDDWKRLRSTFNPVFTSGNLKNMDNLLKEISGKMKKFVSQFADRGTRLELRGITSKFSIDVLAQCVFGFSTDSFCSRSQNSKFLKNAKGFFIKASNANIKENSTMYKICRRLKSFKLWMDFHIPNIVKNIAERLGFHFFGHFLANEHAQQLRAASKTVVEKYLRNDEYKNTRIQGTNIITMMMEAIRNPANLPKQDTDADQYDKDTRIPGKIPLDMPKDDDVIAAALLMLAAGYDTTATAMAFVLYELASNPKCQANLLKEIKQSKDGDIDIPYLDAVIHESMRKNPILANLERVCTDEEYHFDGHNYTMKKGEVVRVSNIGICLDPDIFPEPHKFYPERFLNDRTMNQSIYKKSSFAFSLGPRNCIARKFAMYEKIGIVELVKEFKLISDETHEDEMREKERNPWSILGLAKDGLNVKFQKRG